MMHFKKITFFLLSLYLTCTAVLAAQTPANEHQLKASLVQLQNQMKKIEKTIYNSQRQEKTLLQQLATLEKEMGESQEKLRDLKAKSQQHNKKLTHLHKEENQLLQAKEGQQKALAQLLQATFRNQQKEKLRLILEQNEWSHLARTHQYYQFFFTARAKQLETLQENLKKLSTVAQQIQTEQQSIQQLFEKINSDQQRLKNNQEKRKKLLVQLNQEMSHSTQKLSQLQQREAHLNEIFKTLNKKLATTATYNEPTQNFAKMKRKLPMPLSLEGARFTTFGPKGSSRKTYIAAPEGTPVAAIFEGQVVFAEWLRGIGLLLIVDHGQGYMTLYGNNQKLYKKLGDLVKPGEMISRVGQSGGHAEPGLYFEIRKNGEALDPTVWLKQSSLD